MSGRAGGKSTIKSKSPAMKKWQQNYLKDKNEQPTDNSSETVIGFFVPTLVTLCFFMFAGILTADDSWGIIAAFGMTMVFWPVISIIFILYYKSKSWADRMKGATNSLLASLALWLLVVVFGGLMES